MDKGDNIDDWFTGEGYGKKNEIIAAITQYKADMKTALGTDNTSIISEVESKFDVSDVKKI
jgi:hypothetical protein